MPPIFGAMKGTTREPLSGTGTTTPPLGSEDGGTPPPTPMFLLLENGDFVLLEDGVSKVELEAA